MAEKQRPTCDSGNSSMDSDVQTSCHRLVPQASLVSVPPAPSSGDIAPHRHHGDDRKYTQPLVVPRGHDTTTLVQGVGYVGDVKHRVAQDKEFCPNDIFDGKVPSFCTL